MSRLTQLAMISVTCLCFCIPDAGAATTEGSDKGEVVSLPPVIETTHTALPLKDPTRAGLNYEIFHADGAFFSENPDSPFYRSTYLAQGSLIKDLNDREIGQATVIEATNPDGDTAWAYFLHWYDDGPGAFYFMAGTGKWYGITGEGTIDRTGGERTDGAHTFKWEMQWKVEEGLQRVSGPADEGPYTHHTKGWHFSSPHFTDRVKDPGNGYLFLQNYQEQKMIVTDPEDPFYCSTGYWQGTTVMDKDGKKLMDTGIKPITRPDGDAFWLVGTWWYAKGPCEYRIIGGTGKWKGIRGVGKTRPREEAGLPVSRVDLNHNLPWEFHWKLEN
jgi:hypothetical protein